MPPRRAITAGMPKETYIYQAPANGATLPVSIPRELKQLICDTAMDYGWFWGHFAHYLLGLGLERFLEVPVTEAEVGIAYAGDDLHEKA